MMIDLIRAPGRHLRRIREIENQIARLRVYSDKGIQPEPDTPAKNVRNCHSLEQCLCEIVRLEGELTEITDEWKNARLRAYSVLLGAARDPKRAEVYMCVIVDGMSQRDAALETGVHRNTINQWVRKYYETV